MSDRDLRNLYEGVRRGDEYIAPKNIELLYNEMTKNDLHKLIDKLPIRNGDDAQIQKLYNRINAFMAYEPVKGTLDKKNYNKKIIKKFLIPSLSFFLQKFLNSVLELYFSLYFSKHATLLLQLVFK